MAGRIVRMGRGKPTPYDGLVRETPTGWRWTGEVAFDVAKLAEPLRWKKPRRIFVNSMSDLFHDGFSNEQIAAVFGVMAACPQHTFLVLTKRSRRMREWFEWLITTAEKGGPGAEVEMCVNWADSEDAIGDRLILDPKWPLPNVHLGVSVENQEAADDRVDDLRACPAAVRWISGEPLLGAVAIDMTGIGWVVAGCESGANARPCDVAWLRSLRDQCEAAGVPFWLKQAHPTADFYKTKPQMINRPGSTELVESWDVHQAVSSGPGSKRKPGGIIDLPYLDGVQHAELPCAGQEE